MRTIIMLSLAGISALTTFSAPLQFSRVDEATYAVFTRYIVDGVARAQQETFLYRLEFQDNAKVDSFEVDTYRLSKIDMDSNAIRYNTGVSVGFDKRGQLPLLYEACRLGHITGVLSPDVIYKKTLLFPALENIPTNIADGVEWEVIIPPIILEENLVTAVISGEKDVTELMPASVKNKVLAFIKVNGRECIHLNSSISVKAGKDTKAEYQVESYFDIAYGIPIVNIIRGEGAVLNNQNKPVAFSFFRKEVLASVVFPIVPAR